MQADEIRFLKGRLHFNGSKNAAPFPSCIVVWRRKDAAIVEPAAAPGQELLL